MISPVLDLEISEIIFYKSISIDLHKIDQSRSNKCPFLNLRF